MLLSASVPAAPLVFSNVVMPIGTREVWGSAPLDVKVISSRTDRDPSVLGSEPCAASASGGACLRSHSFICCSHVCPFSATSDRFLQGAELLSFPTKALEGGRT